MLINRSPNMGTLWRVIKYFWVEEWHAETCVLKMSDNSVEGMESEQYWRQDHGGTQEGKNSRKKDTGCILNVLRKMNL